MKKLKRPEQEPNKLATTGGAETEALKKRYDDGHRDFGFKSSIWSDTEVKTALQEAQHEKCCFCESKLTHIQYGDVEHFRPKRGYVQQKGDPLERPGYYWLAYDWDNLMLACTLCNQRFKGNLFPLANSSKRARNHHESIEQEEPYFVDPYMEDPAQYISFRGAEIVTVDDSERGRVTISGLALNRDELVERRKERYDYVEIFYDLIKMSDRLDPADIAKYEKKLEECFGETKEYSGMIEAAKRDEFECF